MPTITYTRFIKFLQDEINLSQDSIAMAQKNCGSKLRTNARSAMAIWTSRFTTTQQNL